MINRVFDINKGDSIAIKGYRVGCGKTQYAIDLAAYLSSQFNVCVVTSCQDFRVSEYGQFCDAEMGLKPRNFEIAKEPTNNAEVTIYDGVIPDGVDKVLYIMPNSLSDIELGIQDKAYIEFCRQVRNKLTDQYAVEVEFISEYEVCLLSHHKQMLTATDWVVIRELERQMLSGSSIGNIRRHIRDVRNNSWENVHKF